MIMKVYNETVAYVEIHQGKGVPSSCQCAMHAAFL